MFLIKNVRVYGDDAHAIEILNGIYAYELNGKYTTKGFNGINLQLDFGEKSPEQVKDKDGRIFLSQADDILGYQEKRTIKMSITGKSSEEVEGILVFVKAPLINTKILSDGVNFLNKNIHEAVVFLTSSRDHIYIGDSVLSFEYGDLDFSY